MNRFVIGAILSAFFVTALLVETTIINFPITFLLGAALLVFAKRIPVFIGVFIVGFIIDSLRITNFGLTPIFLLSVVGILFLYERYSGSSDQVIAGFVIGFMAFFYALFLNYSVFMTVSFISIITVSWIIYRLYSKRKAI